MELVEVVWLDSYFNGEHEVTLDGDTDKFGKLIECRDIGYLVRKNRKEVVLSVSRCIEDNTTRISNTIPRRWVKDIIPLVPKQEAHREAAEKSHAEAGPSVQR